QMCNARFSMLNLSMFNPLLSIERRQTPVYQIILLTTFGVTTIHPRHFPFHFPFMTRRNKNSLQHPHNSVLSTRFHIFSQPSSLTPQWPAYATFANEHSDLAMASAQTASDRLPDFSLAPRIDQVGAEERAARFTTRSIKNERHLSGLKLLLNMIDVTTL